MGVGFRVDCLGFYGDWYGYYRGYVGIQGDILGYEGICRDIRGNVGERGDMLGVVKLWELASQSSGSVDYVVGFRGELSDSSAVL